MVSGEKVAMQPICGTRLKIWGSTKTYEIVLTSAALPFMNNNNFDKTLWQVLGRLRCSAEKLLLLGLSLLFWRGEWLRTGLGPF